MMNLYFVLCRNHSLEEEEDEESILASANGSVAALMRVSTR